MTWELLRGMMQKQPMTRLTPTKALALLKLAGKPKTAKSVAVAEKASKGALAALCDEIKKLKDEHKIINLESDRLKSSTGVSDAIVYTDLQMLKKKKLFLKDQIARLDRLLLQSS
mmetsp:Transcript_60385/g.97851  ORF Transcript_60385/g.97851 Transcript_60385/m.97851 type:complete len:115 (+) Transcript_60385:1-345(+)